MEDARSAHPNKVFAISKTGDLRGNWDQEQLIRVASNLFGNAAVHGRSPGIQIEVHGESAEIMLKVTNQGDPIPPDKLNSIFDPLVRDASEPSSLSSGLGLGLFIVRGIVRAHRGTVTVTSSQESGTAFTVRLPR